MENGHPQVVVDLSNQLGNQFFQFAAARQFELDGALVVFSDKAMRGRTRTGIDRLEQFTGAKLRFASPRQELGTGCLPRTFFKWPPKSPLKHELLTSPIVLPTVRRILRTSDHGPRPATLPDRSLYRITGMFQHRSWFERSLDSVLAGMGSATRDFLDRVPSFDLCVNLRRGDYVSLGWDLPFDYYVRSLEIMPEYVKSVVVTSDDRLVARAFAEYLKSNGYDARPAEDVVIENESLTATQHDQILRDFCLIGNAKNVVMSNSTYCWWAVAMGDTINQGSSERVVAYPQGWLGFPDLESDGLLRSTWTMVPR